MRLIRNIAANDLQLHAVSTSMCVVTNEHAARVGRAQGSLTVADPLANSTARLRAILAGPPGEAALLLKAGAEAGMAEAQAYYGQILLDGRGIERNPEEAVEWFRKAAAAGHLMAVNMLGRCHELGWGVQPDRAAATALYRQAAEGGLD